MPVAVPMPAQVPVGRKPIKSKRAGKKEEKPRERRRKEEILPEKERKNPS